MHVWKRVFCVCTHADVSIRVMCVHARYCIYAHVVRVFYLYICVLCISNYVQVLCFMCAFEVCLFYAHGLCDVFMHMDYV